MRTITESPTPDLSLMLTITESPTPDLAPVCMTHIPALNHHKSNCQKELPPRPQICHLCVLDPYNSTHTIIRVTAKKRDHLAPRFATSVCWTPITALTPSSTTTSAITSASSSTS